MRNIEFRCQTCAKQFIQKNAYKGRIPKYCSTPCFAASIRKNRSCPICKCHVTWNNKTFCSRKCFSSYRNGKKLSSDHCTALSKAKAGKPILHLHGEFVKEGIRKKISRALAGKPQPWMRGENHHNYKDGGKGFYDRQKAMGRTEYKTWRRLVFERDGFSCVLCKNKGTRLNADHIKPWALFPESRYELENGRTLCVPCHRKTPTWGSVRRGKAQRPQEGCEV